MRAVIQRVSRASVTIGGQVRSSIGWGFVVLLGVTEGDTEDDADWLVKKISQLRVFNDAEGVMNCSLEAVEGRVMVISQFTLFASYKKGNRPSWLRAAGHATAIPLYEYFCRAMEAATGREVATGEFGADMKVELVNDGPVTICMDTKARE